MKRKQSAAVLILYFLFYVCLCGYLLFPYAALHGGIPVYRTVNLAVHVFLFAAVLFICFGWLCRQLDAFQAKSRENRKLIFTVLGLMYLMQIACAVVYSGIFGMGISDNQSNNVTAMQNDLLSYLFAALIFAPFMEEMVFRGCLCRMITARYNVSAGMLLSSLLFGFMHVTASFFTGNLINLLYIVEYSLMGFMLAYAYIKSDNIFVPVSIHFLMNAFAVMTMIL